MPTTLAQIEGMAREILLEPVPNLWSSSHMQNIARNGCKDLWRSIVDLKQEHYLNINATDVFLPASTNRLSGLPSDIYKVYLIEPRDLTSTGAHSQIIFTPMDWNDDRFAGARAQSDIDPSSGGEIFFCVKDAGAPTGDGPNIETAPQVTAQVNLAFSYYPTLPDLNENSFVHIPGEDNALVAWTIAFARASERDDRSPDPSWMAVYSTEKQNILQGLGVRQVQAPQMVLGVFEAWW